MPNARAEISMVVPVYNEVGSLPELHRRLEEALRGESFEIVYVDDGSSDGSAAALEAILAGADSTVRVVSMRRNFGKSSALFAGIREAAGSIILTIDADLQNDPADIPAFLTEIRAGSDLVMGWRQNRDDPKEKTLPSRFFNAMTRRASGLHAHDFNCGLKAYRREVLDEVPFYGDMHRYMPVLAHRRGFRVKEIKVAHHPRRHGESKYGWERYLRGGLDLLTVMFLTTYSVRPMHLFGGVGLGAILFGAALFTYLVLGRWVWGESIGTSPLYIVSFFSAGMGGQLLLTGVLAELLVHWRKTSIEEFSVRSVRDNAKAE